MIASVNHISHGYFATLKTPSYASREFTRFGTSGAVGGHSSEGVNPGQLSLSRLLASISDSEYQIMSQEIPREAYFQYPQD